MPEAILVFGILPSCGTLRCLLPLGVLGFAPARADFSLVRGSRDFVFHRPFASFWVTLNNLYPLSRDLEGSDGYLGLYET